MADFSKFSDGTTTYDVKDATARAAIAALEGGSYFLGKTTTPLTDGATTNPVVVNGESVTATNGNIVAYGNAEFIWDGTKWVEFGDLSNLGELATKDTATGSYTPAGSVETEVSGTVDLSGSTSQSTTVNSITGVGTLPSFTYDSTTETLSFAAGTLPTKGENTSVLTSVTVEGQLTGVTATSTFTGTPATITVE